MPDKIIFLRTCCVSSDQPSLYLTKTCLLQKKVFPQHCSILPLTFLISLNFIFSPLFPFFSFYEAKEEKNSTLDLCPQMASSLFLFAVEHIEQFSSCLGMIIIGNKKSITIFCFESILSRERKIKKVGANKQYS